ncbi:MAG: DUF3098 domain-containing protein [Bacteroidales bacterium]|nr:DUF3098 domain-containing protein [Bacteroides sp.]MCM1197885.1 DUF3098 domain-containing protein [Clostridium sp.]MCM1501979.1 DUF3098 domain-containing protein [Bacteroidales bacterium]
MGIKNNMPVEDNSSKMAITPKGLKLLLAGLVVMVSGYILMIGGGSDDPEVFNYAMFDFRRLVAAPSVIILGIVIEIVAIMGVSRGNSSK